MAKFAATDYKVTVNGTNLSTNLNSVELSIESDDLETTAFGGEWRTRIGGLKNGSITLSFLQDFGAASVDATLFPLFNTLATVVITPTSGSVNSTNPSYTATALVNQYMPFASSVGDIATLSVTWPTIGTVARATA
jgi:predicted secreted protein